MSWSSYSLLMAAGLFGSWIAGCTHSAALPPPASIPSPPLPPLTPGTVQRPLPPAAPPIVSNPWKPVSTAREWKHIVIHHTATSTGSVESIHEAHLKKKDKNGNPWLGIGYHFVIGNGNGMGDGEVEPTFRWKQQMQGAHAGGSNPEYNQVGIGVCLVGNFEETPPTDAQRAAVRRLVQSLKSEYHIPASNVIGHKDVRTTECPGKLFPMSEVAADDFVPFSQLPVGTAPQRLSEVPGSTFR